MIHTYSRRTKSFILVLETNYPLLAVILPIYLLFQNQVDTFVLQYTSFPNKKLLDYLNLKIGYKLRNFYGVIADMNESRVDCNRVIENTFPWQLLHLPDWSVTVFISDYAKPVVTSSATWRQNLFLAEKEAVIALQTNKGNSPFDIQNKVRYSLMLWKK